MADKCILLVEGKDDQHVFAHLAKYHQIPLKSYDDDDSSNAIRIKDEGGIEQLLANLPVRIKADKDTGLERLGIIADADTDIGGRWDALRNKLIDYGYVENRVPEMPNPSGTIIEQEGEPLVGIWLMPNNTLPGMLEDFIKFLVPQNDALWERAGECIGQIPEKDRLFDHLIQAHVHTWLAWQKEPGKPLGLAITFRYLDPTTLHARQFINWVRRLFSL